VGMAHGAESGVVGGVGVVWVGYGCVQDGGV